MQSEIVEKCVKSAMLSVIKEHPIGHWNDDQVEKVARRAITEAALSAAKPQPAPSVAVKAIEAVWKYSLVIESSVRRGDGPDQYAGVTEALRLVKEARSALSAQVQDVATKKRNVEDLQPVINYADLRQRAHTYAVVHREIGHSIPYDEDFSTRETWMAKCYRDGFFDGVMQVISNAPAKQEG